MNKIILLLLLVCNVRAMTEREIIASTISMEARGEGKIGMLAVADVLIVRGNEKGISAAQVCLEPRQFSCWNRPTPEYVLAQENESWSYCLELADAILSRAPIPNVVYSADHYCAMSVKPKWADPTKETVQIGHHVFYKL